MSENKDIIQENTSKHLFGEKFDEKITKHVKLKKNSREFFNIIDSSQIIRSIMATTISSFEKAPSPNRIEVGGSNFFSYHQNQNRSGNIIGKSKFKSSFLFIPSNSLVNARISKCTWFSKKYIPCKNFPKATFNREGEIFCKKLGKINKRPSCVEHCSRTSVSFHRTLLSNFFTSGRKYYSRGKVTGERK